MSNKIYTSVPVPKFPRNTFSLSRPVQGSMTFHKLYPTNAHINVPGDGFIEGAELLAKMEPMIAPVMTKIDIDQHAFFVPYWQLNEHFDDFITAGEDGKYLDKMPFVYVNDLYLLIDYLLDFSANHDANFEDEDGYILAACIPEYKYRLDLAVRILEMCDWFRAVPFVKPDFQYNPSSNTQVAFGEWVQAQLDAFESLNSHLSGLELRVNLLPFFAYQKVYSEYFRDENLAPDFWKHAHDHDFDELTNYSWSSVASLISLSYGYLSNLDPELAVSLQMNRNETTLFTLELFAVQRRAWSKDRFTGALPFAQKGDDVLIPIHGVSNLGVVGDQTSQVTVFGQSTGKVTAGASGPQIYTKLDLAEANTATIRELREAYAAEDFVESNGRFGSRYPEFTLGQFGVVTPDARLPRAIFLGSRTQPVMISDVTQNSSTTDISPQGNLAGKGASYSGGRIYKYRFTLHGVTVVITSIRVKAIYESGIAPMFSYFDRTDYAFPRFARLGEEPVYQKEVSLMPNKEGGDVDTVSEDQVFGYAPRYSSFKSDTGSIHGLLKGSRAFWTLSRRFGNMPKLNQEFIYNSPRLDSFAITNPLEDQFTVQINFKCRAQRILPFWGTPSI